MSIIFRFIWQSPEKTLLPSTSTAVMGTAVGTNINGRIKRNVGRSLTMDINQQIQHHFTGGSSPTAAFGSTISRRSSSSNSASSFTTQAKLSTLSAAFRVIYLNLFKYLNSPLNYSIDDHRMDPCLRLWPRNRVRVLDLVSVGLLCPVGMVRSTTARRLLAMAATWWSARDRHRPIIDPALRICRTWPVVLTLLFLRHLSVDGI